MYGRASRTVETLSAPKTLIRGAATRRTRKVLLLAGVAYAAGSVVGIVAATTKAVVSTSAATDGSQTPMFVLAHDADATAADREAVAYETGDFCVEALVIGAGHTAASIREGLRGKGITFG